MTAPDRVKPRPCSSSGPPPCSSSRRSSRSAAPGWSGRAYGNTAAGGVLALGAYGFVATFQPDARFGRVLAAYGGVFGAGSLLWGTVADGYRPGRWGLAGALICLAGMAVIMWAPWNGG